MFFVGLHSFYDGSIFLINKEDLFWSLRCISWNIKHVATLNCHNIYIKTDFRKNHFHRKNQSTSLWSYSDIPINMNWIVILFIFVFVHQNKNIKFEISDNNLIKTIGPCNKTINWNCDFFEYAFIGKFYYILNSINIVH